MNKNKIKEYWNKSKYWKKGLIIALIIFLLLNVIYLIFSILVFKEIVCPDFGGGFSCGLLGYLIISFVHFFWYFIFIGLPLIIIFSVVGYFIRRK